MPKSKNHFNSNQDNIDILRAKIRQESECEIKDILTKAKAQADYISAEARAEAVKEKEGALQEADKEVSVLREQLLCAFNVERKRIILEEKSNFIKTVMAAVKQEAENLRASRDYHEFLIKAIIEAITVTDEAEVVIFYSLRDKDIFSEEFIGKIKEIFRNKSGKKVALEFKQGDFNDIGILAQSADTRLTYDNRFLSRLKRSYDDIYMQLLREIK
jgi:vacuolar-type H+-ATPase subunit E/Vma4